MRHLKNDKLSARERIDKTLNFEEPDRVPMNEFVQNFELVAYLTGKKITFDNYFDLLCEVLSENVDVCETVAPPLQPRIRKESDGFIYKDEWWTSWVNRKTIQRLERIKGTYQQGNRGSTRISYGRGNDLCRENKFMVGR